MKRFIPIVLLAIALAIALGILSRYSSSSLQTIAEPDLASGAKIVRFIDDQWAKDPVKIWRLCFSDEALQRLTSKYYHDCDGSDTGYIKKLVSEKDSEFDAQRSGPVFRKSSELASKYVFQYGSNEMYFVVIYK